MYSSHTFYSYSGVANLFKFVSLAITSSGDVFPISSAFPDDLGNDVR